MHHTAAFHTSTTTSALLDIPAVTDDVLAISNSHFLLNRDMDLVYAATFGAAITRARLSSPSFRQVTLPELIPYGGSVLPGSPPLIADYRANPLRVKALEELGLDLSFTAATADDVGGVVGLSGGFEPVPRGDIFTLRGTATTTLSAWGWTTLSVTWADTLPAGTYAVVGLVAQSTNAIAGRLIFDGQSERPGSVSVNALTDQIPAIGVKGGLGVWGRFRSTAMPQVQILSDAADTAETVLLDIIRLAA